MSDDLPSLAEAMAEIRRLRARVAELEAGASFDERLRASLVERSARMSHEPISDLAEALRVITAMAQRIAELEAAAAIQRGTLQMQTQQRDDGGTRFTWDVPPSAPPHNE